MKLYLSPGACSLADHIALHEAGIAFERVRVDLKAKTIEDGGDYRRINPKGYVPALALDDGEVLTENIAILAWIADQAPSLKPPGSLGAFRLLEMLAFISTEIHKGYKPFFTPGSTADEKAAAGAALRKRFDLISDGLDGDYLFGARFSVADAYLFVMLTWARANSLALPPALEAYFERVRQRPAVRLALEH